MQPDSFKKGDLFEDFVSDNLFKAKDYDLEHRTNNYEQNKERFSKDTLKPDLKFTCLKTTKQFYVEAKYRARFNANNQIKVISYGQIERFKVFQKEENTPVFIAVGYGGVPENPEYVSLIPLNQLVYLDVFPKFLKRFNIPKEAVNSTSLNLLQPITEVEVNKQIAKTSTKTYNAVKPKTIVSTKKRNILIAAIIGIVVMFFIAFKFFNSSIEDTLKQKTTEYYSAIHSKNIDELQNYISPNVDTWYSKSNISFTEIKNDTKAYVKRHPATSTNIEWDTFKVTTLEKGYAVSYNMLYKLLKENKGKDRLYHLKIRAIWDKDFKITSMYEEKL